MTKRDPQSSPLYAKTQQLAVHIRAFVHDVWRVDADRDLLRQLMRSGASVGANYREAWYAESTSDFIHKLKIARKEASETLYWLDLLDGELSSESRHQLDICRALTNDIIYMTSASVRTVERKLRKRT
ncbi:MAG: four helix bundle protein [Bacteroidetes bacterium]|nr:four helix bundle protein [Bacteroidota bacterium]